MLILLSRERRLIIILYCSSLIISAVYLGKPFLLFLKENNQVVTDYSRPA